MTKNSIFHNANFKLISWNPKYDEIKQCFFLRGKNPATNHDKTEQEEKNDPLLIFICKMFHKEVRKEGWRELFIKIREILRLEGIKLEIVQDQNGEGNCVWESGDITPFLRYTKILYKFQKCLDRVFKRVWRINKFQELTPTIKINDPVYNKALNQSFRNKEIKNIALTGPYGCGKSSTWLSYVKNRKLKKVITVSLGKYNDIKNSSKNNRYYENRLERQIINQISSQIRPSKIPLSKYSFIKNKNLLGIILHTILAISFISSIVGWIEKDFLINKWLINQEVLIWLLPFLFFIPLTFWIFNFIKNNRFYISKIKFNKVEANFEKMNSSKVTIMDKEIREIIYLLYSSNTKVVVFEDLDRFHNTEIFMKLKEINFILNSYTNTKLFKRKPVRFVYMLSNTLFSTHIRTKFFDFIIPIVPIVNSSNSESKFYEFLQIAGQSDLLDENVIWKISLYISDIRLVKNIVNEFSIYNDVLKSENNQIEKNKLFALIALKNLMPKEFNLLQLDKGYIFNVFENIKKYKKNDSNSIKNKLIELNDIFKNYVDFENNKSLKTDNILSFKNISDLSESNELIKDNSYIMKIIFFDDYTSIEKLTSSEICNNFIHDTIKKIIVYRDSEILKLYENIKYLEEQLNEKTIKYVLKSLPKEKIDTLFLDKNMKQINADNISFLKFLFMDGLIDESYLNYMSYFHSGVLGINDRIFIKNILEHVDNNNFRINLENPRAVLNRLSEEQLKSYLSFNIHLFKESIYSHNKTITMKMFDSVWPSNKLLLAKALREYNFDTIKKFISIFEKERSIIEVKKFLEEASTNNVVWECLKGDTIKHIIVSAKISTKNGFPVIFSDFIFENIPDILNYKDPHYLQKIINSLSSVDESIKMEYINKNINYYSLNVKNVVNIYKFITDEPYNFSELLTDVFNKESLSKIRNWIEENFAKFIKKYINSNKINESYKNDEPILISIINSSDINYDYKKRYMELNEMVLSDLNKIDNLKENREHIKHLFEKNKIMWSPENFKKYIKQFNECDQSFAKYFNNNINSSNYENILKGESEICNILLNSPYSSKEVIKFASKLADPDIKK